MIHMMSRNHFKPIGFARNRNHPTFGVHLTIDPCSGQNEQTIKRPQPPLCDYDEL